MVFPGFSGICVDSKLSYPIERESNEWAVVNGRMSEIDMVVFVLVCIDANNLSCRWFLQLKIDLAHDFISMFCLQLVQVQRRDKHFEFLRFFRCFDDSRTFMKGETDQLVCLTKEV